MQNKLVFALLSASLAAASPAHAASTADNGFQTAEAEEYPYLFPVFGQKAIDAGEEIPLPFGISAAYYYVNRDIEVSTVSASINNNPLQSVDDLVSFEVGTEVQTATVRADMWIFPFLNIFGLYGHIDNSSTIHADFNIGTNSISMKADGGFKGETGGVGAVLAGGYADFFMTLDGTYIISELGNAFNTKFRGQIYNARAGWKGKIKGRNTRIWLGATYWDTERKMSGTISVNEDKPLRPVKEINFEVVQKPVNPANMSLGFNYEFTDHFNLVFDYGFNFDDVTTVLLSLNYRLP